MEHIRPEWQQWPTWSSFSSPSPLFGIPAHVFLCHIDRFASRRREYRATLRLLRGNRLGPDVDFPAFFIVYTMYLWKDLCWGHGGRHDGRSTKQGWWCGPLWHQGVATDVIVSNTDYTTISYTNSDKQRPNDGIRHSWFHEHPYIPLPLVNGRRSSHTTQTCKASRWKAEGNGSFS